MSAFGGKADMTFCENPLSRSLFGVKRTSHFATHMSAYDPKWTWAVLMADGDEVKKVVSLLFQLQRSRSNVCQSPPVICAALYKYRAGQYVGTPQVSSLPCFERRQDRSW